MDKLERAGYIKKLIKLYRKQGKSAKESRQLAGEAMRLMAQGKEWQAKAQRKADKLQRYVDKAIVETFNGIDVLTLPAKNTRRTYKNNGCRILSRAKAVSNALFMDVAQGKGRDKSVHTGADSTHLLGNKKPGMTYRFFVRQADGTYTAIYLTAKTIRGARHLRQKQNVVAHRYCKRLAEKN